MSFGETPNAGTILVVLWIATSVAACVAGLWRYAREKNSLAWLTVVGSLSLLGFTVFLLYPCAASNTCVPSNGDQKAIKVALEKKSAEVEALQQGVEELLLTLDGVYLRLKNTSGLIVPTRSPGTAPAVTHQEKILHVAAGLLNLGSIRSDDEHLVEILALVQTISARVLADRKPKEQAKNAPRAALIQAILGQLTAIRQNVSSEPDLRRKFGGYMSHAYYVISPIPREKYVLGQVGSYYLVELKDGETRITFPRGKFSLDAKGKHALQAAMDNFTSEVLNLIPREVKWHLYVRGNASNLRWRGTRADGEEPGEITMLKGSREIGYNDGPVKRRFNRLLENNDLPDLRAAYLQTTFAGSGLQILEGHPSCDASDDAHYAELVLYIEW